MKNITWKIKSPFDSAAMAGRIMGTACAKIISRQPGYRRGQTMSIFRTTGGTYRLYALINGQWMDASLSDLPQTIPTLHRGEPTNQGENHGNQP